MKKLIAILALVSSSAQAGIGSYFQCVGSAEILVDGIDNPSVIRTSGEIRGADKIGFMEVVIDDYRTVFESDVAAASESEIKSDPTMMLLPPLLSAGYQMFKLPEANYADVGFGMPDVVISLMPQNLDKLAAPFRSLLFYGKHSEKAIYPMDCIVFQ